MKKGIVVGVLFIVAAIAGISIYRAQQATPKGIPVKHMTLEKADLIDSISTKGVVESTSKKSVYSSSNLKITTVNVEIGDTVTAGQTLCLFDIEDLELSIAQSKAELTLSQKNNLNQVQNNQRLLNEASNNLTGGSNQQISSAEASVKTAEKSLENAKKNYDDKIKELEAGTNQQIVSAKNSLETIKIDLKDKEDAVTSNKILFDSGVINQKEFEKTEMAVTTTKNQYDTALSTLTNAEKALSDEIDSLKTAIETAEIGHQNAVTAESVSRVGADQELEKYKNSIESAKIASSDDAKIIAIQKLERQLAESVVTAPIAGTITAVMAKEESVGNGLLFVIEDTNDFKIVAKIKEYDSSKVKIGLPVVIKSDALENIEYQGSIEKIAPTSLKNTATGEPLNGADVEFETEIHVNSKNTELKIGMNSKLNIILEKRENIFYVPIDSLDIKSEEEAFVLSIVKNAEGSYIISEVPVDLGMENDFYIEITGKGLEEGLMILSDIEGMKNGMEVIIDSKTPTEGETNTEATNVEEGSTE